MTINTNTMKTEDYYYQKNGDNYFDFSKGQTVSETEVNMFIHQCIDSIKEKILKYPDRESYFHHMSTGNTKVIIECYRQGNETEYAKGDKFTVYISVATAYKEFSKTSVELIPQIV